MARFERTENSNQGLPIKPPADIVAFVNRGSGVFSKIGDMPDRAFQRDTGIGRSPHEMFSPVVVSEFMSDPEHPFWSEFASFVKEVPERTPFLTFLRHFDPAIGSLSPAVNKGQLMSLQYILTDPDYASAYKAISLRIDGPVVDKKNPQAAKKRLQELFYNSAPEELQEQLARQFPGFFGEFRRNQEIAENETILTSLIGSTRLIGKDGQEAIVKAYADYQARVKGSTPDTERKVVERVARKYRPRKIKTPTDVIREIKTLAPVFKDAKSDDEAIAKSSKELLEAFTESLFIHAVKVSMYKEVAMFWRKYLTEYPNERGVPEGVMGEFIKAAIERNFEVEEDVDPEVFSVLFENILPRVTEDFLATARSAQKIKYFKQFDEKGNPKPLFFHQVEGIRYLMEKGGGILADEPGTGKTITIALAALNKLDEFTAPNKRVMVVGSKRFIDNWERELGIHIELEGVDIINVNYTNVSGSMTVPQRLDMMEREMQEGSPKQVMLVNYDLFRDPRFYKIVQNADIQIAVVDEAQNVRSKRLGSVDTDQASDKVAYRTLQLYRFLQDDPDRDVILATGTPMVKSANEPLIMAHLAAPDQVPLDDISIVKSDQALTHAVLRSVMIRRRKEEVADLPPRVITPVPIPLEQLTRDEQEILRATHQTLEKGNANAQAKFLLMLAYENQAKFPWLIETIKKLREEERKVLVFTPFKNDSERFTSLISTRHIAKRLRESGIEDIANLDGDVSERESQAIQDSFRRRDGTGVIVGNYPIAGQSLTFNSPENRATEIIIFVAPDRVDNFLQAVDRTHRIGQTEQVNVHLPYATRDTLGREKGTYDERIVSRLVTELSVFEGIIDGSLYSDTEGIYTAIMKGK